MMRSKLLADRGTLSTLVMKPSDLARVPIDLVQPEAVMFPTDAKLLNRERERGQ
jgi:hypothetical protein